MKTKTIKYLSLFSGLGGFEAGIDKANINWKCIGFSDIYQPSVKIYKKNFPDHKELGDLTKIDCNKLEDFDVLVAGFSCQPYSVAGKRNGLNDERGQLIYNVFNIIKEKQPKVVLLENVKGLVSHEGGQTLERIVSDIEALGYDVNYEVLNTVNFGIPHNRTRIFFVAFRKDLHVENFQYPEPTTKKKLSFYDLLEEDPSDEVYLSMKEIGRMKGFGTTNGFGGYLSKKKIYNCITSSYKRDNGNSMKFYRNGRISALSPIECERLQGFDDDWTKVEGVKTQDRYRGLGNAVTVDVIKELVKQINKHL